MFSDMSGRGLGRRLGLVALLWCASAGQGAAQGMPNSSGIQPVTGRGSRQEFEMNLLKGEQEVISAQGVKTYSEGTEGVVDVRLTGDAARFVVVGKSAGSTTLLFLMLDGSERSYRITVVDPLAQANAGQPVAVNPLKVDPRSNVRLDLYFVQLDRSGNTSAGINVPSVLGQGTFNYGYDMVAKALVSNTAVIGSELLPTLELAQTQGWAKVQRHVAVVTTNGKEALFDSGGEFNVAVSQGLTATVQSIAFGTVLGVTPRYDEETHRMEMVVKATISDLAASAASIPGRNRSMLNTVVNLSLGESLAVAGLTSVIEEEQKTGIPGLSQIPIIGYLFGKRIAKKKETENVVFVVPSVVEPMQRPRAKEFIDGALRVYADFSGRNIEKVRLMPSAEDRSPKGESRVAPAKP